MSIDMDVNDTLKAAAISSIENLIDNYIKSTDEQKRKKGVLISYWLKEYANYLEKEDSFDCSRLKKYERGDVIKVNLGYRIGSEHGGLHYCVVMDNYNSKKAPVITVVPLGSVKGAIDDEKIAQIEKYDIFLGDELYLKLMDKQNYMSTAIDESYKEASATLEMQTAEMESIKDKLQTEKITDKSYAKSQFIELKAAVEEQGLKLKTLEKQEISLKKVLSEIKRMKQGSYAIVSQITTVSKLRIFDPRSSYDVLSGIKLSPKKLDKINLKMNSLFMYQK